MAFAQPLHLVTPSVDMDPITGYPVASPDVQGQPGGFQPPLRFDATNTDEVPPPAVTPQPPVQPPTPAPVAPPVPVVAQQQQPQGVDYSSRDAFIRSLYPSAKAVEASTGIPADVLLAIPLNEQGAAPAPGNNFYGIKGSNTRTGATTGPVNTWENYGNGPVNTQASFRAYATPQESMQDFADFLKTNSRYRTALGTLQQTGDPAAFVREVHRAGYATDPQWSDKIISLMHNVQNVVGGAASAIGGAVGGAAQHVLSAFGGGGGVPSPRPQTGLPPDVAHYPTQGYQPQQPPPSLVQDMYMGQQQGLVPTTETAPYQFPDLFGGIRSGLNTATQTAESIANVGTRARAADPFYHTIDTAIQTGIGNLTGQLRDTMLTAAAKVGTATNQAEFDAAMKAFSQAEANAAIQLTGNVNETPGMGAGEVPPVRPFSAPSEPTHVEAVPPLPETPQVHTTPGMGETPSQAWARMNAEAQAGMGTTPEAAISPDVPPVPVTPAGETPPPLPSPSVTGTGTAATQNPRGTYESLNASPLDTQVTRDLLATDPYTVIHNADTMAGAAQRTLTDPLGALRRVLDESKPLDTNGIADAMQLARKAVNDGDMASIKAITKRLASEGTETAQKLQIYSQIDNLSPEGTIVELYRQIAKGTGSRKGVARAQKTLNEAEVEIIRQKAADRLAAVDELRRQSSVRVKTVKEAVDTKKAIPFDDFLKGMQDLLKETRPRAGAGAKTETLGMSIGLPTPGEPRSALEVSPEDAARFYQRGQDILQMTNATERAAARDALFADIRAHKIELTKADRAEERAAAAAEKLKTTQAAREVAARKRDAITGLNQFEREQAQAVVQPVEQAAKDERLRLESEQRAADKAVRDAAAAVERAKRLQDRAAAQSAARDAAEQKRAADSALGKFEKEQAQAAIAPTVEQRSDAAQASLEQQRAQSYTESLSSLQQQQQTSFERANASLEQQRAENPARSAAALGRQQVRETDAAALARESGITYLSDREARIAKEQIKRTMEEDVKIAMRRQVRQGDFELPDAVAQNFQDRATTLRNMPTDTPNQKLEQLLAGQQLMGDLSRFAPKEKWGPLLDLWGLSRTMETTMDNSYALAQGGLRFLSNPVAGVKTLGTTTHALFSEDAAKSVSAQFLYGQHSGVLKESGLVYDDPFAVGRGNEFYPTAIAQKIPGVKQSERAFASGGNKDRMDLYRRIINGWLPDEMKGRSFDSIKEMAAATGRDAQDFRDLATWFNVWTGKGQMNELFRSGSPLLNLAFFAPRTFASHLQVPYYAVKYGITNSELRPVIARELSGLALTMGAIYGGVAAYAQENKDKGIKIQTDPLQSGFGDIQVDNHHINLLMGYGPLIHAIATAQEGMRYQAGQAMPALAGIGGQRYNLHSANGKAYNESLGETLFSFLRGKLQPDAALVNDIRLNKDFSGNPVTTPSPRDPSESAAAKFFGQDPRTRDGWENLIRRFAQNYQPMAVTDVAAAIRQDGIQGGALAVPFQFLGGRDNVYETTAALRNRTANDMGLGKDYAALTPFDKAKVDAAPEVQQVYAQQDAQSSGVTDKARTAVTLENYQLRTKAIEDGWNDPQSGQHHYGLSEIVKQGITGPPLVNAIKAAQDARYQAGLTTFNELYEAAKGQPIAPEARDALRQAYLAAEPVENPDTHELDYTARDNQRSEILRQAVASGIDPNYLTQKISPWKDTATAKAVDAYHADQDTLRPYFDMGKTLQASNPAFRAVVLEDMRLQAAAGTAQGALALQKFERETGLWHMYQADEQRQREMLRQKDAELDAAGVRLGRWAPMPKITNYPPNAAASKPFDFNNPPPMPAMPPMKPMAFPPMPPLQAPAGIR